jgi:hypothetical protein
VSDRLSAVERQLTTANKRIADLETKYLALLEDIKALRTQLTVSRGTVPSGAQSSYQPAFERWPSPNPDDERARNAAQPPTPSSAVR